MPAQDLIQTPFLDLGFLFARVLIGLLIAAHGAQKLFGWFGGHGLPGTAGFFEGLGFRPGRGSLSPPKRYDREPRLAAPALAPPSSH